MEEATDAIGHGAVDWEAVARAETNPQRLAILELLTLDGGRVLSPLQMAFELQTPLTSLNYHVRAMQRAGLLELVGERRRRGAVEHFYRLAD